MPYHFLQNFHARLFIILMILLGGIAISNILLERSINSSDQSQAVVPQKVTTVAPPSNDHIVTKYVNVIPGAEYFEAIFYMGNQEIARLKENKNGVYDQQGAIPNGAVKVFYNQSGTSGKENYEGGHREGWARVYFQGGQRVKSEIYYKEDKVLRQKEYNSNGTLNFEVDNEDALNLPDQREVGDGKLYYPDGTLRYEWNFTNHVPAPYRKAYNPDGTLRYVAYYNKQGELTREERGN